MSSKLNRLKGLPGAETQVESRNVKIDGLGALVAELREMAAAARASKQEMTSALQELKAAIAKEPARADNTELVEAIRSIELKVTEAEKQPPSYRIEFERDERGLMKSGVTVKAI